MRWAPFVVVAVRLTATGRTTGIPVEQRLAQVWTVRDGQAIEVRSYASFAQAVEAAGGELGLAAPAAEQPQEEEIDVDDVEEDHGRHAAVDRSAAEWTNALLK